MKLFIHFLLLSLLFCQGKKQDTAVAQDSDKKSPEMLLLKLSHFEGDVSILRNDTALEIIPDLELEADDIIKTGQNGTIELLLGIEDSIKISNHSEVVVNNVLTLEGDTATHISLHHGKVLTILKDSNNNLTNLITPNMIVNLKENIIFTELVPKDPKNISQCDKASCISKVYAIAGNALVKPTISSNGLTLEKQHQISISGEEELKSEMILPIEKQNFPEIKSMLSFQASDLKVDSKILDEYSQSPTFKITPAKSISVKIPEKRKTTIIPSKLPAKHSLATKPKPAINQKKSSKDYNRDKLKLAPNRKF